MGSFLKKSFEPIELDNRKRIYGLVKKSPGCHFREIERKIKMPYGTLKYHLNFLVRREILIEKRDGKNLRYFPRNIQIEDQEILGLLRQSSIRKILVFLVTSKEQTHKEIVRFTARSAATVNWHLNKLLRKEIVSKNEKGVYKLIVDKNNIIKLLILYKESFLDSIVNHAIEMWEN